MREKNNYFDLFYYLHEVNPSSTYFKNKTVSIYNIKPGKKIL